MREFTSQEKQRFELLTKHRVSFTLIQPTLTGLKKSIMDATGPVRSFLLREELHDYDNQKQGPDNKVIIDCQIYLEDKAIGSQTSLYRPLTKSGDPRIWFYKLSTYAKPNDLIAIVNYNNCLRVINITQIEIETLLDSPSSNPIKDLVLQINKEEGKIASELLYLLRKIAAQGPILSMVDADTSVGRTLEHQLGIDINSSKKPDYKGIELKSFRGKRNNRKTLFAQVPDWKLSKFKSSAEILDAFGYWREDDFKLYCTVSATTTNSQGLSLKIDSDIEHLIETSNNSEINDFVVWALEKLHKRLTDKHGETFWVEAESKINDGKEYFQYSKVEHTKGPIISQFDLLIEQGVITLDHLIKRNAKGKVVEKGPLFKIKPSEIGLLFPPSETYELLA